MITSSKYRTEQTKRRKKMKGKFTVIGKNGERFNYRYMASACNKYFDIYGVFLGIDHFDAHVISVL
jgi:hypothetical protein